MDGIWVLYAMNIYKDQLGLLHRYHERYRPACYPLIASYLPLLTLI